MSEENALEDQLEIIPDVNERKKREQATINEAWAALRLQLAKIGLEDILLAVKEELGNIQLQRDTFDGSYSFFGVWQAKSGAKLGTILIHEGGQVFAEFDVSQPHPTESRWFIDSVNIWGRRGAVKAELKLLQAL